MEMYYFRNHFNIYHYHPICSYILLEKDMKKDTCTWIQTLSINQLVEQGMIYVIS